ncbi:hypothetical protein KAI46_04250 [bacterium]|nr:hypothetical protein [bacterium]
MLKQNPKMITKALEERLGVLNPQTTELFILDELAAKVFDDVCQNGGRPLSFVENDNTFPAESKDEDEQAIVAELIKTGVLVEV